jgi:hypothetical protein
MFLNIYEDSQIGSVMCVPAPEVKLKKQKHTTYYYTITTLYYNYNNKTPFLSLFIWSTTLRHYSLIRRKHHSLSAEVSYLFVGKFIDNDTKAHKKYWKYRNNYSETP